MKREDVINLFLKEKILLSPTILDFITQQTNIEDFIDKLKKFCLERNIFFIDENVLNEFSIFIKKDEKDESFFEIKLEKPEELVEFTTEDISLLLRKRFDFLSTLITQNNQLTDVFSISKIVGSRKTSERVKVIGIVKDKTTYTFTLEDHTGYMVVFGEVNDIEKINIDEVIGVEVQKVDDKFKLIKIYYPSFTFFREIKKIQDDFFISNFLVKVKDRELKIEVKDGLKLDVGGVKVFLLNFDFISFYLKNKPIENLTLLLEKRHLNPTIIKDKKIYKDDFFLLKEIPDYLVVLNSPINEKKIYKGVQIFLLSRNSMVNLKNGSIV
ncbi:MAG: hypothetical protein RMJ18_02485 [Candidatus Aenigmarchaeota archaeon]|nr:hypothetical protein [Candidatus Aenigmarchaeota archaeon]MDW8160259.1 hypothetical protein [Candidatus Aenigmarchaeota archaeon]